MKFNKVEEEKYCVDHMIPPKYYWPAVIVLGVLMLLVSLIFV